MVLIMKNYYHFSFFLVMISSSILNQKKKNLWHAFFWKKNKINFWGHSILISMMLL